MSLHPPLWQPQTEWVPPEEFPDLSKYTEISIDLETKDPDYHYDFIDRGNSIKISVNPNKLPYQVYE